MNTSDLVVPVDMERMRDAADGDEEFLRQLVEVFLDDADSKVLEIQAAITANDLRGLGRTAHQLKGSSANVGASRLQDLAKRLEQMSRGESLVGADEVYRVLQHELGRVHEQLEPIIHP